MLHDGRSPHTLSPHHHTPASQHLYKTEDNYKKAAMMNLHNFHLQNTFTRLISLPCFSISTYSTKFHSRHFHSIILPYLFCLSPSSLILHIRILISYKSLNFHSPFSFLSYFLFTAAAAAAVAPPLIIAIMVIRKIYQAITSFT